MDVRTTKTIENHEKGFNDIGGHVRAGSARQSEGFGAKQSYSIVSHVGRVAEHKRGVGVSDLCNRFFCCTTVVIFVHVSQMIVHNPSFNETLLLLYCPRGGSRSVRRLERRVCTHF